MSYGFEWMPAVAVVGALVILMVPAFALIGVAVLALAALAALVALTGVIIASPYLLARALRRHDVRKRVAALFTVRRFRFGAAANTSRTPCR